MKHLIGGALAVLAIGVAMAFAPTQQTRAVALQAVPRGAIVMWTGALADIPRGWRLCDGTRGTPDLWDRFVKGVSERTEPGWVGGTMQHSHGGTVSTSQGVSTGMPSGFGPNYSPGFGANVAHAAHVHAIPTHAHGFVEATVDHRPPFYEVAYIMKL